jgi:predicted transcriptional regulator
MAAHRIHCVVLTLPGAPPRLVTDFEIVGALHDGTLATSCADELAREAPVVARDDTIARAADTLYEHRTTHAVVVADLRSLRPVGVLSVLDIAEALVAEEDH